MNIDKFSARTGRMMRENDTVVNEANGLNDDGSLNVSSVVLLKSTLGEYFLGQTEELTISGTTNAYAELYNPIDSGIHLHLNVWTSSNLSSKNYTIGVMFNAGFPVALDLATKVMSSNLGEPMPIPKAQIRYKSNTVEIPTGVEVYTRRVPSESTVIAEEDGKYLVPPGKVIGLYLRDTTASGICRVAFGWWEELE